jgi:hypothetical protein
MSSLAILFWSWHGDLLELFPCLWDKEHTDSFVPGSDKICRHWRSAGKGKTLAGKFRLQGKNDIPCPSLMSSVNVL